MSVRNDVIQEVINRIKGITVASGSNYTVKAVTRDTESFSEEDEFPIINIVVDESKTIQKIPQVHSYAVELPITIEAITKDTTDVFESIEPMLSDIKKAMMVDTNLSGLCNKFTFDGDSEATRQYGGSFVSVAVGFTIEYLEDHCNNEE